MLHVNKSISRVNNLVPFLRILNHQCPECGQKKRKTCNNDFILSYIKSKNEVEIQELINIFGNDDIGGLLFCIVELFESNKIDYLDGKIKEKIK